MIPYNQRAISFVNRLWNAVVIIRKPNSEAKPEFAWQTPGVSALAAMLWFEADRATDYGGDTDIVLETHPILDAVYEKVIVPLDHFGPSRHPIWDAYDLLMDKAATMYNEQYLAALVVNAMVALDNGVTFIWADGIATLIFDNEFKAEQEAMDRTIRAALGQYAHQFPQIGEYLARDNAWLLEAKENRRRQAFLEAGADLENDPHSDDVPMKASTQSDIDRIDMAIDYIGELNDKAENKDEAWDLSRPILDALNDGREAIISLQLELNEMKKAEKANA